MLPKDADLTYCWPLVSYVLECPKQRNKIGVNSDGQCNTYIKPKE